MYCKVGSCVGLYYKVGLCPEILLQSSLMSVCYKVKLGQYDAWFVFVMRHASWFTHRVYEKMCLIWGDVSSFHSSHLVRQFVGKLTHQSKLYVLDSKNLLNTFTYDAPQIRTTHRVDPALDYMWDCSTKSEFFNLYLLRIIKWLLVKEQIA